MSLFSNDDNKLLYMLIVDSFEILIRKFNYKLLYWLL